MSSGGGGKSGTVRSTEAWQSGWAHSQAKARIVVSRSLAPRPGMRQGVVALDVGAVGLE